MTTNKGHRSATTQLREQATVVGDDVQEFGRIAREMVNEQYEHGREKAMKWEKSFETQIKENPLQSVLIAAGAGLLIGVLLGRR